MKLLSFKRTAPRRSVPMSRKARSISPLACARRIRTSAPRIRYCRSFRAVSTSIASARRASTSCGARRPPRARFVVANPKYLPPVTQPPKILALALNFQEHIDETNLKFYEEPIVFAKYPSNMIGHEAEIELPPFPQKVDEEHELGLIVGRDCRHIRPSQAADYIFGWTICNDVYGGRGRREARPWASPATRTAAAHRLARGS